MIFDNSPPQGTLTVKTMSRPKRVAFLIHPENITAAEVDEIIKYSASCWGGRYYPIVPCSGDTITSEWWKVLKTVDPDIIYSLVLLSDDLVNQLNRFILPSKIIEVQARDIAIGRGIFAIHRSNIGAINTAEIPRYLWEHRGVVFEPYFYLLDESKTKSENISFYSRNFGLISNGVESNRIFRDLPHETIQCGDVEPIDFLSVCFPPHRRSTSVFPLDLSSMFIANNYSLDFDQRSKGFHLVVGDDPWDVIYAWNLALQNRNYNGRNWLWLSRKMANDDNLLIAIGVWISKVYWDNEGRSPGAVVSSSIDASDLMQIAKRLTEITYFKFNPILLNGAEFPFPDSFNNANNGYHAILGSENLPKTLAESVPLAYDEAVVHFPKPVFVTHRDSQGEWMVEAEIQYRPERYLYTNISPNWKLPKRLGLAGLFFKDAKSMGCRIAGGGIPCVEVSAADTDIKIAIPSDRAVIWQCCFRFHGKNTFLNHVKHRSEFEDLYTSDKGRYLSGIIRLFGSLFHTMNMLDDPFWRGIVFKLAGHEESKVKAEKRKRLVLEVLQKQINKTGGVECFDENILSELAEDIANKLTFKEPDERELTLKEIMGSFSQMRRDALQMNSSNSYWKAYKKFDVLRKHDFEEFCANKIFIQGVLIRCPSCYTTSWRAVDNLRSEMMCESCMSTFPFPNSPDWRFRLNELVGNAIRRHGILPVLQALHHIDRDHYSSGMFLYLPSQDVYKKNSVNSKNVGDLAGVSIRDGQLHMRRGVLYTDLDLIFIKNGRFGLGEVKSDPIGFKPSDFEKLQTVALDFMPDDVLIAAYGLAWPSDVDAQIKQLREKLSELNINVVTLLMQWQD